MYFFNFNIFVQMQVDKYLYMIIENEIMNSSGYANILNFRLRQTGQEVLCYCGYWRHTNILEEFNVYIERCAFRTIILILIQTSCNYVQETSQFNTFQSVKNAFRIHRLSLEYSTNVLSREHNLCSNIHPQCICIVTHTCTATHELPYIGIYIYIYI